MKSQASNFKLTLTKQLNQSILRQPGFNLAAVAGLVWIGLLSAAQRVEAHHAIDGTTPTNFFDGFISGLAHPVIGLDHFAFVVAIGLVAAERTRGMLIPAAFVLSAIAGTAIHLLNLDLPAAEIAIATSVIVLGVILFTEKRLQISLLTGLATLAGLFHGYAYGEAIIGAQMTPLFAYLLGFTFIQLVVALGVRALATRLNQRAASRSLALVRLAGYGICTIGVAFLATALIG